MTDDNVIATELDLNAHDVALGIVSALAMTYRRAVVVVVEDGDGVTSIGTSNPWPERSFSAAAGLLQAKRDAVAKLVLTRRNRAEHLAAIAQATQHIGRAAEVVRNHPMVEPARIERMAETYGSLERGNF